MKSYKYAILPSMIILILSSITLWQNAKLNSIAILNSYKINQRGISEGVLNQIGAIVQKNNFPSSTDWNAIKTIDEINLVYINREPYLYYNILDGGTGATTVIHGLINSNDEVYWIEYFGDYAGLDNNYDTILPSEINKSEGLEKNTSIYNILLKKSEIKNNKVPLKVNSNNTY